VLPGRDSQRSLVCGQTLCQTGRHTEFGTPRSSSQLRPPLPRMWRRIEQIQFLLGHASVQTTERYIGCKQNLKEAVNDRFGISVESDAA
jgi:hypothetical protein